MNHYKMPRYYIETVIKDIYVLRNTQKLYLFICVSDFAGDFAQLLL
jgi:hypothetical protein